VTGAGPILCFVPHQSFLSHPNLLDHLVFPPRHTSAHLASHRKPPSTTPGLLPVFASLHHRSRYIHCNIIVFVNSAKPHLYVCHRLYTCRFDLLVYIVKAAARLFGELCAVFFVKKLALDRLDFVGNLLPLFQN